MKTGILSSFTLDGIDYYYYRGNYYCDNLIIRKVISYREYSNALMDYLILS